MINKANFETLKEGRFNVYLTAKQKVDIMSRLHEHDPRTAAQFVADLMGELTNAAPGTIPDGIYETVSDAGKELYDLVAPTPAERSEAWELVVDQVQDEYEPTDLDLASEVICIREFNEQTSEGDAK